MIKNVMALVIFSMPMVVVASEKWVPITHSKKTEDNVLLDVNKIETNGNGDPVGTLRMNMGKGYRLDMLTEFDCKKRRIRNLSSAAFDGNGKLISANGISGWQTQENSIGLDAVCK